MLLNNNNGPSEPTGGGGVVFRRQKHETDRANNNNNHHSKKSSKGKSSAGGGTSSVRNSWSFTTELPMQHHGPPAALVVAGPPVVVKENIYADPEALFNAVNSSGAAVARSRLRQRSVSNLNAAALAGTRGRDHSSSNRHHQANGTMSAKGVDYIRIHHPLPAQRPIQPAETTTVIAVAMDQIQDRSEYGNPDGSSAHSTAEREGGVCSIIGNGNKPDEPPADLYQAINQNQSNDYKMSQAYLIHPQSVATVLEDGQPLVRGTASGRASSTTRGGGGGYPSPSSSKGSKGKTEVGQSRKSTAGSSSGVPTSTGPNAVKTEWTFLPSPTAPTVEPLQHREINSKPEESSMVRKGLLWVMRDRLFSRYHERYCILTRNYLHCFKKGSEASLTQMGNFLFKVNLAEVIAVQWLDKRGTAIVCLTLAKEGRLLVKTSMDLTGWYDDLQNCVKETIGRRQTLLMDQRKTETFVPSVPTAMPVQQQPRLAGQQPVVYRERSLTSRNRSTNRFSLMSDHEVKLVASVGAASESADNSPTPTTTLSIGEQQQQQPHSLGYAIVPAQVTSSTPPPPAGPPVPVPYRERSVSFDRSRASKAEREAKRRSYYPSSHVTQV